MLEYPQGFAISKISDNFLEHQDIASFFGIDDVCSLVAVPFIKKGRLTRPFYNVCQNERQLAWFHRKIYVK